MFSNEHGDPVDVNFEKEEQELARMIPSDATVLELGARYGTVSCVISSVLSDPTRHVAVEPDGTVINALTQNRDENGGKFHIYNGVVSNENRVLVRIDAERDPSGYGTYTRKSDEPSLNVTSLVDLQKKYNLEFDCLVADCEGFIFDLFEENPWFYDKLRMIIYEKDGAPWSKFSPMYEDFDKNLKSRGFVCVKSFPHPVYPDNKTFHTAWVKA